MADLYFEPNPRNSGFETQLTAPNTGDALPIIRELIQNSLDAGQERQKRHNDSSPISVEFIISNIFKKDIPHIDTFRQKLDAAIATQEKNGITPKDKAVAKSIKKCADNEEFPTLFCIDDGIGINPDRMHSLLGAGQSRKESEDSAGSFGLGHQQAFAATDLRYVLYAGKYMTEAGQSKYCASGHAVLATFVENDVGGGGNLL